MIHLSPDIELGGDNVGQLQKILQDMLPKGRGLNACYSCGACASGCPASGLADMDPRKFVRMISLGMDEEVMFCDWVWMCTTCNRCVHVCPMNIDIPQMVFFVRKNWPENRRPEKMVNLCRTSSTTDTCSSKGLDKEDFKFIVAETADTVREEIPGFETFNVPLDRKGAELFLNQDSRIPVEEPDEMGPLWKILYMAGADWTYGSQGWASENYCMFLSDDEAWEGLVRRKAAAVDRLGCKVLLNTECGHDFYAMRHGLDKFGVPHSFEIKSIVEYYARWIREGRLKVRSDWNLDLKVKFTVQDPCQLVRKGYGDLIADELRFVIEAVVGEGNFIDMVPNRSNNYCCGGGGGAIETDFGPERREYGRIKLEQILDTRADYCITICNNCLTQIRHLGEHYDAGFRTVHLWTVLGLALGVLGKKERKYLGDDLKQVGLI